MKISAFLILMASPLWAHVMSMSTGDISITAAHAHYELSMPIYEVAHITNPSASLFEHIHFSAGREPARLVQKSCHDDVSQGAYLCSADYEFPAPVEEFDVECTFYQVTVPNHVHLLRATMGGKNDQAIFDFSYTTAPIRFRPPTTMEVAAAQIGAGFVRAVGGLAQILFLATLALAARSRRELAELAAMFHLAGTDTPQPF